MRVIERQKVLKDGTISYYLDITETNKNIPTPTAELKRKDPDRYRELFKLRYKRRYEFLNKYIYKWMTKEKKAEIKSEVRAIRIKREQELNNELNGISTKDNSKSFLQYFTTYTSNLKVKDNVGVQKKEREKPKTTHKNYESTLGWLTDFIKVAYKDQLIKIRDVNRDFVKNFVAFLSAQKLHRNTVHMYYSKLNRVLNELVLEGYLTENPTKYLGRVDKPKAPSKADNKLGSKLKFLDEAELKRLIETPFNRKEIRDAFLFICFTGLRWCDVEALKWRNIRDGRFNMTIQKTETENFDAPLGGSALEILNMRMPPNVKPLPDKKVFDLPTLPTVNTQLKKWAKAAKVNKDLSSRYGRHTFGTSLARIVDRRAEIIQELMCHKKFETSLKYIHVTDQERKNAISKLPKYDLGG